MRLEDPPERVFQEGRCGKSAASIRLQPQRIADLSLLSEPQYLLVTRAMRPSFFDDPATKSSSALSSVNSAIRSIVLDSSSKYSEAEYLPFVIVGSQALSFSEEDSSAICNSVAPEFE
jgi:hypothetical protein